MPDPKQDLPSDAIPQSSRRKPVLVHQETTPDPVMEAIQASQTTSPPVMTPTSPQKIESYFIIFDAIARVLSVRLLALVGVFGAIGLAFIALQRPELPQLGVLLTYCLGLALIVWLAGR